MRKEIYLGIKYCITFRFTTKPVGMKDLIMKGLKFPNNTDTKIVSKEVKDLISRMLVPDPN